MATLKQTSLEFFFFRITQDKGRASKLPHIQCGNLLVLDFCCINTQQKVRATKMPHILWQHLRKLGLGFFFFVFTKQKVRVSIVRLIYREYFVERARVQCLHTSCFESEISLVRFAHLFDF